MQDDCCDREIRTESSRPMRVRRPTRAFTLIELMIVVGLMAILAAVIVPALIRARERSRKDQVPAQTQQTAQAPAASPQPTPLPGAPPVIDEAQVDMTLDAGQSRIGMDVYTRFEVAFNGRFAFRTTPAAESQPVRLEFGFPTGTTEARDVKLLLTVDQKTFEPENVRYSRHGIAWAGPLAPGTTAVAQVAFVAQGRDRFSWGLPPASRLRSVRIALNHRGGSTAFVPDHALQPTTVQGQTMEWRFQDLVTDRRLILEIPAAETPLGRVVLLSKLVAVAVLLFGLGFWYLAELWRAGCLSTFRWGHFLLLALTYSLFFVVFAVMGFRGSLTLQANVAWAALFSLPLLLLHVSRILDATFAFTRVLPLALFTLLLVLVGVYGDDARDLVFIGAAFVTVAFVTVTFKTWSARQEGWHREQEAAMAKRLEAVSCTVAEAAELDRSALALLREVGTEAPPELKTRLEEARKRLLVWMEDHRQALGEYDRLLVSREGERRAMRPSLEDRVVRLAQSLPRSVEEVSQATCGLRATMAQPVAEIEASESSHHCPACGATVGAHPFCPTCGKRQPRELRCAACQHSWLVPVHIIARSRLEKPLHCPSCGGLQRGLEGLFKPGRGADSRAARKGSGN